MKIIAAGVGMLLAVTGATSVASATEPTNEPCVPSEGVAEHWSEWTNEGPEITQHDETRPGTDTETERWRFIASSKHITQKATPGVVVEEAHWQRYSWNGVWDDRFGEPPFPHVRWQPNTQSDPHDVGEEGAYFVSHGSSGKGDWFYLEWVEAVVEPGLEEISHIDYFWQKQVRTLVPAVPPVECPEEPETPEEPEQPEPEEPNKPEQPTKPESPVKQAPPSKETVTVPTSVDAGL